VARAAAAYYWKPRTYTWSRALPETKTPGLADLEKIEAIRHKMGIEEKLKSLALQITTGKIFSSRPTEEKKGTGYQVVTYLTGEKKVAKRVDYKE
jgi:hypothetical protein